MNIPEKVYIREVGLREGLQTHHSPVATNEKLELARLLSETGVSEIELTSMVRPDRVPQMADADELLLKYEPKESVKYTALYLNQKGFIRAEQSGRVQNDAWIHIAASETFLKKNTNKSIKEVIASFPDYLKLFKEHNKEGVRLMLSTAFGCNYEGEISHARVAEIVSKASEAVELGDMQLSEVCLADTMGWASPGKLRQLLCHLRGMDSELNLTLHLHDTRGTGIANAYAGLLEGVTCFDASVGGIGGCPFAKGAAGNIATEDLVFMLHELGIETGIDLDAYVIAARFAEKMLGGSPLSGKYYKTAAT